MLMPITRPGLLTSRRLAGPVCCILQIAGSLVFGILRIGTQRAFEALRTCAHHLIGSDALFNPFLQRADRVERVDAGTAAAMAHSRSHEETHPVALTLAHLVEDGLVVPNCRFQRDPRVGPFMGQQEVAAARFYI